MSLRHALLGFVQMLQPISGYDLKKWFEGSVCFYWPATHTQVYRTLKEMAEDSWLSAEVVEQSDRPDKKTYSITHQGREELTAWLRTPLDLPVTRHGLLVQLSFADQLTTDEILRLLTAYTEKVRRHLDFLRIEQQQVIRHARSEREGILWGMVRDSGVEYYSAELRWVENALRALSAHAQRSGSGSAKKEAGKDDTNGSEG